jgi:hypothetical protein
MYAAGRELRDPLADLASLASLHAAGSTPSLGWFTRHTVRESRLLER